VKKKLEHIIPGEKADSIVLYRLPYHKSFKLLIGRSEELVLGVTEQVIVKEGFVFEPFDNYKSKGVYIDKVYSDDHDKLDDELKDFLAPMYTATRPGDYVHSDYASYNRQFDKMHQSIQNGVVDKVILSRTMPGPSLAGKQVIQLFEELTKKYPHAFVYAISTPVSGIWVGAGPELLLKHQTKMMSTVSLAGTLPNDTISEWTAKELEEQQLVTDYVEDVLIRHQVKDIIEIGPETMDASQVKHLCTRFNFQSDQINGNHLGLLYELHPTPAVCGMPKENARRIIVETEAHDRKFYSGFLGPVNNGHYQFYVNIRCLEVLEKSSALFIGGGLTKDSEVKKEWDETELKAETLLSVLKNI